MLSYMASACASQAVGTPPPAAEQPRLEFAFEEYVLLEPTQVIGQTAFGQRQYIPILGGTIAGPKFRGKVLPGGWDLQLGLPDGCRTLSADYFIQAEDGTRIHVLNQGMLCPASLSGGRSFYRPTLEAPVGPHEWLNRSTFVVTNEVAESAPPARPGEAPTVKAIRLKFYLVK
ncbi:MAG: DUF3237 domain-containing protein [Pseudomonadota bacterium]